MTVQSIDYVLHRGRQKIVVPEVEVWVCEKCGERVFPYESSRRIETYKLYSGMVSLRIEPSMHARLAERAKQSHRSLNQEIVHLLKAGLRQSDLRTA
jgi:YgiT-type zinc finger domain-containing protein